MGWEVCRGFKFQDLDGTRRGSVDIAGEDCVCREKVGERERMQQRVRE